MRNISIQKWYKMEFIGQSIGWNTFFFFFWINTQFVYIYWVLLNINGCKCKPISRKSIGQIYYTACRFYHIERVNAIYRLLIEIEWQQQFLVYVHSIHAFWITTTRWFISFVFHEKPQWSIDGYGRMGIHNKTLCFIFHWIVSDH